MTTTTTIEQAIPTGTWGIDTLHSSIGFEVKHLGISTFRGGFADYAGTIETEDGRLSRVEGTIQTDSIDINDEQLGGHLRSPDFFDVERYPEAHFVSTSIEEVEEGRYRLVGDFTLRGATHPVTLDVTVEGLGTDPGGNERLSLLAEGELDRTAYGLTWNSTLANGAAAVSERVRLVLSVEAVRSAS